MATMSGSSFATGGGDTSVRINFHPPISENASTIKLIAKIILRFGGFLTVSTCALVIFGLTCFSVVGSVANLSHALTKGNKVIFC
jgi:hypothetical protein